MSLENLDICDKFENLQIESDNSGINILLLGETGVGKSTFVNALANYITYKFIDKVDKLHVLIPSVFKVTDKFNKEHEIAVGSDSDQNEFLEIGVSATQDIKPYVFKIYDGRVNVRVIDTPGMGDTRGIKQDEINCENIINCIKHLGKIHAICLFFKPTNARLTMHFEYCLTQILSRIDKSAYKNIIFVYTNTRASNYSPGDTMSILQKFVNKTSDVDIPLTNNLFCFDNEAFKYLAAVKKNIEFDDTVKNNYRKSWEYSAKHCWSLIRYILGTKTQKAIKPYTPEKLLELNIAKLILGKLSTILSSTLSTLNDWQCQKKKLCINRDIISSEIDDFKKKMQIAVTDVQEISTSQPLLVCTSGSCAEIYKVGNENKWHYKSICHMSCTEIPNAEKDIIGCPALAKCWVIDKEKGTCLSCHCEFLTHKRINYITRTTDCYMYLQNSNQEVSIKENKLAACIKDIEIISTQETELKEEYDTLKSFCVKLAYFIQQNAIVAFNDSYKDYVLYNLLNYKQGSVPATSVDTEENLKELLNIFDEMKDIFEKASTLEESPTSEENMNTFIENNLQKLFALKHNGDIIRALSDYIKHLESSRDFQIYDYVHEEVFKWKKKNLKEDKSKNKQSKPDGPKPIKSNKKENNDPNKLRDKILKELSEDDLQKLLEEKRKADKQNKKTKAEKKYKREQSTERLSTPPPSYSPFADNSNGQPVAGPSQLYHNHQFNYGGGHPYPPQEKLSDTVEIRLTVPKSTAPVAPPAVPPYGAYFPPPPPYGPTPGPYHGYPPNPLHPPPYYGAPYPPYEQFQTPRPLPKENVTSRPGTSHCKPHSERQGQRNPNKDKDGVKGIKSSKPQFKPNPNKTKEAVKDGKNTNIQIKPKTFNKNTNPQFKSKPFNKKPNNSGDK